MSSAPTDPPKPSKRKWDQPAAGEEASSVAKVAKTDEGKTASEAAAAAAAIAAKIAAQFANGTLGGDGQKDQHDAEFTHDIDINDVRNRYLLTRGSTQDQVCLRDLRSVQVFKLIFFRFTRRPAHQWARGVFGTQIGRKQQRKIHLCTFTSRRERRTCWTKLWPRSMSSFLWTWALWWKKEIRQGSG